jgi:hypothetical protein
MGQYYPTNAMEQGVHVSPTLEEKTVQSYRSCAEVMEPSIMVHANTTDTLFREILK